MDIVKISTGKVHKSTFGSVKDIFKYAKYKGETLCGLKVSAQEFLSDSYMATYAPVTCKRCLAILEKQGRVE